MGLTDQSKNNYINYWLHRLTAEEREAFEEQYFTDTEVFESLQAARHQLMHDYCCGRLAAAERERFEQFMLSLPESRFEMQLMQNLLVHQEASQQEATMAAKLVAPAVKPRWYRLFMGDGELSWGRLVAAGASLLICLGIGGWFYSQSQRDNLPLASSVESAPQESLLALSPAAAETELRGSQRAEMPTVVFEKNTGALRLRLTLPFVTDSSGLIQVLDLENKKIVWQSHLPFVASQKEAEIIIPRAVVPASDYRLTLLLEEKPTEHKELARYHFAIRTK